MLPGFYRRESEFHTVHLRLKQQPCPHCKRTGALILHGYLHGYDLTKVNKRMIRGHRIFCSNRNRRRGCGRTFSVVLAVLLKRFVVQTSHLWSFLRNIVDGMNTFQAFNTDKIPLSRTSIYRLYKRVYFHQSSIRSLLLKRSAPPRDIQQRNPLIKTIRHIQLAFKRRTNPPAAFQYHFQRSFL